MRVPDEVQFQWIAEWGFDFVRIPLCYRNWLQRKSNANELIEPEDAFAIDESQLEPIDQIIAHGTKHGLNVCLSFHHAAGERIGRNVQETFILWQDQSAVDAFTFHWNLPAPPQKLDLP